MSRTSSARDAWHPQTRQDREAILLELQQILASPHFCNSKRYPALLQYIVENTLAGRSEMLKERTLGVEVFDRSTSYDTNADTVVRYTAGEVRKRLSLYYHELDRKPAIRISLPAGSYIPEFLHSGDEAEESFDHANPASISHADWVREQESTALEPAPFSAWAETDPRLRASSVVELHPGTTLSHRRVAIRRRWWLGIAAMVAIALLAGFGWRYRSSPPRTPMEDFWAPLLHDQHTVLVCAGSVVFKQGNFSGVITADRDTDYPFVSIQGASAISLVSSLVARNGRTINLQFSASTPLAVLREQPVILLGGYNNLWTLRLLEPMPFHFAPPPDASIVNPAQPQLHWKRDQSLPYSSADDYAIVARIRDTTTDGWIVVLAGIGRNGAEAAAQFVTSPHYMQLLRDRLGRDFGAQNIEAVVKVNVIDGKTGAPSLLAVQAW
jgi:hypothetical protein